MFNGEGPIGFQDGRASTTGLRGKRRGPPRGERPVSGTGNAFGEVHSGYNKV